MCCSDHNQPAQKKKSFRRYENITVIFFYNHRAHLKIFVAMLLNLLLLMPILFFVDRFFSEHQNIDLLLCRCLYEHTFQQQDVISLLIVVKMQGLMLYGSQANQLRSACDIRAKELIISVCVWAEKS